MYYERLKNIYSNQIVVDASFRYRFPEKLVHHFDHFIRENIANENKYLSPYSFAIDFGLRTDDAIQLFILFSSVDGVFNIVPFFECSNIHCPDERIYIENGHDPEDPLFCDECERPYFIDEIRHYIKLYFQLKPELFIPEEMVTWSTSDPNSTYEALQRMPDYLKGESPSLLSDEISRTSDGEGDYQNGVPIDRVLQSDMKLPSDVEQSLRLDKLAKKMQYGLERL